MEDMTIAVRVMLDKIYKQREEILQAFIAKYGYEPDEVEQVIISDQDSTVRWFVRKKENPNKEALHES